ncbi:MAG: DUF1360 domain-containing protein [Planctomycetaceae bacterium]|nr:DUF1360 domain-containing protein [Planctomycetaceae bacterium]
MTRKETEGDYRMIAFFLFCLASVGLTAILVDGKVFQPFRERVERSVIQVERQRADGKRSKRRTWIEFFWGILTCYQCCGFWSGLFCGVFLWFCLSLERLAPLSDDVKTVWLVFSPFFVLICGFAGSLLSHTFLQFFELLFYKKEFYRRTIMQQFPDEHHPHGEEKQED